MTTAERNALTAAHGMIVYNSSLGKLENYDGQWRTPLRYHQSQLFAGGDRCYRDAQSRRQAGGVPGDV